MCHLLVLFTSGAPAGFRGAPRPKHDLGPDSFDGGGMAGRMVVPSVQQMRDALRNGSAHPRPHVPQLRPLDGLGFRCTNELRDVALLAMP